MTELINKLNDNLKNQLTLLFSSNKLPHSIIIDGQAIQEKNDLINILCQYAVCNDKEHKPCGICDACHKVINCSHPDIMIIEGSTASGIIGVDDIRELIRNSVLSSNESDSKVYILKNSHLMNKQAQNALLKSIEEPVQNILYILDSENYDMFLDTIKSRCSVLKLNSSNDFFIENADELIATAQNIYEAMVKKNDFEFLVVLESLASLKRNEINFILYKVYDMLIDSLKNNNSSNNFKIKAKNKMKNILKYADIIFEAISDNKLNININLIIAKIAASR